MDGYHLCGLKEGVAIFGARVRSHARCSEKRAPLFPVDDYRENRLARGRRDAEDPAAMRENDIGTQVLEAAINVHRELGPGF